tara:strand:- start:335 stop:1432 length:1098 start_codon:yes stop_codon:yes gene_type:complete
MLLKGNHWKTIWVESDNESIGVIDQTKLPHKLETKKLNNHQDVFKAIRQMIVRGAPLIGVTGGYGFALGVKEDSSDSAIHECYKLLNSARPTAVNLNWSLKRIYEKIKDINPNERYETAFNEAKKIELEDIEMCSSIGENGKSIIEKISKQKEYLGSKGSVNILTHCNAGWLATVDWGTALAPIYKAYRSGIDMHIWVDETRPRNQGASLTAFELQGEGVPCTVIVDNAGGHLMQHNKVDLVIVGSDRTTKRGDVCNKIGTYLKALAARDCGIPFFVALPVSTIDWELNNGVEEITIENRSDQEVSHISGLTKTGILETVRIIPDGVKSYNPSFDVTPAKLITGLITEKGVCSADYNSLRKLYSS